MGFNVFDLESKDTPWNWMLERVLLTTLGEETDGSVRTGGMIKGWDSETVWVMVGGED